MARLIRIKEVMQQTGLARATLYRRIKEGTFPKPVKLGSARSSGWIQSEVDEWIDRQISESRNQQKAA